MGLRQLHARGERLLGARNQVAIEMGRIRVRDHDIGLHDGAVGKHDPAGDTLLDTNTLDRRAQAQGDSLPLHQAAQRLGDGPGAAHGEVHPMRPLEEMDQTIDAGGIERIAAHEEGLDRKCPAELIAYEMA